MASSLRFLTEPPHVFSCWWIASKTSLQFANTSPEKKTCIGDPNNMSNALVYHSRQPKSGIHKYCCTENSKSIIFLTLKNRQKTLHCVQKIRIFVNFWTELALNAWCVTGTSAFRFYFVCQCNKMMPLGGAKKLFFSSIPGIISSLLTIRLMSWRIWMRLVFFLP